VRRLVVLVVFLAMLALGCGIALGGTLASLTAAHTTGRRTTTIIPTTPPSTMIVASPQYKVPAYMRPIQRPPSDSVRRAMTQGPNHTTFTVWTYSNHSRAPWCFIVTAASQGHGARSLGGGCLVNGPARVGSLGGSEEWPCTPGPHDRGGSGPNYFVLTAETPPGVREVKLTVGLATIEAPVTNRWFIAITKSLVSMTTTVFYSGAGQALSKGTMNLGAGTC
jgi:hypothetical protein